MGFFTSVKKSVKLRAISKRLSEPLPLHKPGRIIDAMFDATKRHNQALDELIDLCQADANISIVMDRHQADRQTLTELYHALCRCGASQWISAHYVPASAIAYPFTLDYCLRKLGRGTPIRIVGNESGPEAPEPSQERTKVRGEVVALRLIRYFDNGEVGPISE